MTPIVRARLAFAVSLVRSRAALHLEILALQHQLGVYQRSARRLHVRPSDRVLWSWLARGWARWREVLMFVQPATVRAWQRRRFPDPWTRHGRRGPGRPAIAKEIRELIRAISAANPRWGSPRILGELRKLGIAVAKSTVEKYRVRPRRPSSPAWRAFLKTQVTELVALDFFTVRTVGFKVLFVLISAGPQPMESGPLQRDRASDHPVDRPAARRGFSPGGPRPNTSFGTAMRSITNGFSGASRPWASTKSGLPLGAPGRMRMRSG